MHSVIYSYKWKINQTLCVERRRVGAEKELQDIHHTTNGDTLQHGTGVDGASAFWLFILWNSGTFIFYLQWEIITFVFKYKEEKQGALVICQPTFVLKLASFRNSDEKSE